MLAKNPAKYKKGWVPQEAQKEGEEDYMTQFALIMKYFGQYTLDDILHLPILEAEMLYEQAEYFQQVELYQTTISLMVSTPKM